MTKETLKLALKAMRSYQGDRLESGGEINLEEEIKALEEALKQEQGEPYGYLKLNTGKFVHEVEGLNPMKDKRYLPLYTTPQPVGFAVMQKPWVGLTDEDIEEIWGEDLRVMYSGNIEATKAIEAKLKKKNT